MKVVVCLDDCGFEFVDNCFINCPIYIKKSGYTNNYAALICGFIDFACKYADIVEKYNIEENKDKILVIHTDLMSVCKSKCDGTAAKEVHKWLSNAYKNMKLIGFRRPDKFIVIDETEDYMDDDNVYHENLGEVEQYMSKDVLESQIGDNKYFHISGLNDTERLDHLRRLNSSVIPHYIKSMM